MNINRRCKSCLRDMRCELECEHAEDHQGHQNSWPNTTYKWRVDPDGSSKVTDTWVGTLESFIQWEDPAAEFVRNLAFGIFEDQIANEIERWHDAGGRADCTLPKWLGLTDEQYEAYVEGRYR